MEVVFLHMYAFELSASTSLALSLLPMALAKDPICSVQTSTLLEDGSDGFIFQAVNYQSDQPHSLIDFKGSGYDSFLHSTNGSLLSFEQNEKGPQQHTTCLRTSGHKHGQSMVDQWDPRAVEDFSCFETASNGDWLYYDAAVFADSSSIQDPGSPAADLKRPHMVNNSSFFNIHTI